MSNECLIYLIVSNLSKISEDLGYELKKLEEMRKMPCCDDEKSIKNKDEAIKQQLFLVDKLAIKRDTLLELFKN